MSAKVPASVPQDLIQYSQLWLEIWHVHWTLNTWSRIISRSKDPLSRKAITRILDSCSHLILMWFCVHNVVGFVLLNPAWCTRTPKSFLEHIMSPSSTTTIAHPVFVGILKSSLKEFVLQYWFVLVERIKRTAIVRQRIRGLMLVSIRLWTIGISRCKLGWWFVIWKRNLLPAAHHLRRIFWTPRWRKKREVSLTFGKKALKPVSIPSVTFSDDVSIVQYRIHKLRVVCNNNVKCFNTIFTF